MRPSALAALAGFSVDDPVQTITIKADAEQDEAINNAQIADVNVDGLLDIVLLVGTKNVAGGPWKQQPGTTRQPYAVMREGLEDARSANPREPQAVHARMP